MILQLPPILGRQVAARRREQMHVFETHMAPLPVNEIIGHFGKGVAFHHHRAFAQDAAYLGAKGFNALVKIVMFGDQPGERLGRRRVARGDGGDQHFLLGVMDPEGVGREILDDALDNVVVGRLHLCDPVDLARENIQKTPVLDVVAF